MVLLSLFIDFADTAVWSRIPYISDRYLLHIPIIKIAQFSIFWEEANYLLSDQPFCYLSTVTLLTLYWQCAAKPPIVLISWGKPTSCFEINDFVIYLL